MTEVWAITMMRDEEDVAEGVIAHLDDEAFDGIIVADNLSTDRTRSILDDMATKTATPLYVFDDTDPAYRQSEKMTQLAGVAREIADTDDLWIVPFDADELWTATDRVAHTIRTTVIEHPNVNVLRAPIFDHKPTAADSDDPDPFRRIRWRTPGPSAPKFWKASFRWAPDICITQGNHDVEGVPLVDLNYNLLEVRHFPYRALPQFITKVRNGAEAYRAIIDGDEPLDPQHGLHWIVWGGMNDEQLEQVWMRHRFSISPIDDHLVFDPAAYRRWQRPIPM